MSRQQLTVAQAHTLILERDSDIKAVLPKSLKWERFSTRSRIWLAKNQNLLACDPLSLFEAFFECASDGLVPDGVEAIIVPFLDRRNKVLLAQYQPMYQGLLKRGRQLGDLFGVDCEVVYDRDFYEIIGGDNPSITHYPYKDGPRGQLRAVYAIFRDKQGRVLHRANMFKTEVDRRRRESRQPNGPAWSQWYEEMARKTVVRNGLKFVPTISDELRVIVERDDKLPTVLEGVAISGGSASSRRAVEPLSLDDLDDDGNLIVRQLAGEPEEEDPIEEAEVLPRVMAEPCLRQEEPSAEARSGFRSTNEGAKTDTANIDDALADPFGVGWQPPKAPESPLKAFVDALRRCKSEGQVKRAVGQHKEKIQGLTVGERQQADSALRGTLARLRRPNTQAAE